MPSHLKRYHTEGHYHSLTFSCYRRFPYLGDNRSRTVFLDTLETLRERHRFFVFGYVLMPEHVHLLLSEPRLQRLDNSLCVLKGQTSKVLKGSRAQFWQTRYYDFNVFTQTKFAQTVLRFGSGAKLPDPHRHTDLHPAQRTDFTARFGQRHIHTPSLEAKTFRLQPPFAHGWTNFVW